MKIAYIVPGTGGRFYCENCLRDMALIVALRELGYDVSTLPMYLPIAAKYEPTDGIPIFYGAINLYLDQKLPLFNKAPRWVNRLLDAPMLLEWASKASGSTKASGLEEMTLSMLDGGMGHQAAELDKLISFLRDKVKPDVVHLSNALLLGLAPRIKKELRVPIICSLQDEDTWVDELEGTAAREAWRLMAEKAASVDVFTPVSRFYAGFMQERLKLSSLLMKVVPNGLPAQNGYKATDLSFERPVLGFLSRLTESQGLGVLVEAFIELKCDVRHKELKLKLMGGMGGDDRRFVRYLKRTLAREGVLSQVDFHYGFELEERREFLSSLTLLSVPVLNYQASGISLLEAMASGVPVVQPNIGGFPEIIEKTGGGVLYEPNTAHRLAEVISSLLTHPSRTRALGRAAMTSVNRDYGARRVAELMAHVYQKLMTRVYPTKRRR